MTRQEAIDLYFEGDRSLYAEYAAACLTQFTADIEAGDAACARGEAPAMRRLAHSLKTVLMTLGRNDLSELARAIEAAAEDGSSAWQEIWPALRAALPGALED